MTTWRDIADELTPQQIELLTGDERDGGPGSDAAGLLFTARDWAAQNLAERVGFGYW